MIEKSIPLTFQSVTTHIKYQLPETQNSRFFCGLKGGKMWIKFKVKSWFNCTAGGSCSTIKLVVVAIHWSYWVRRVLCPWCAICFHRVDGFRFIWLKIIELEFWHRFYIINSFSITHFCHQKVVLTFWLNLQFFHTLNLSASKSLRLAVSWVVVVLVVLP